MAYFQSVIGAAQSEFVSWRRGECRALFNVFAWRRAGAESEGGGSDRNTDPRAQRDAGFAATTTRGKN